MDIEKIATREAIPVTVISDEFPKMDKVSEVQEVYTVEDDLKPLTAKVPDHHDTVQFGP